MDCCMLSDMLFSIETLKYCRDIAGEIKGAKTSIKADNGESALSIMEKNAAFALVSNFF